MLVEIVLVVSNLLLVLSILTYFYFREMTKDPLEVSDKGRLADFFARNTEKYMDSLVAITESKDDLFQKTLIEYLKHNERLEKMILPGPVTRKAVEEVLSNMPEMVPNDIEKSDKELDQDQLTDLLSKVPITRDTKIMFEGDVGSDLPEEIISGSV